MPERVVKRVQASPEGLFIYIPSETRNTYEVDVGNAIRCTLIRLINRRGDRVEVNRSLILEVRGYWNELHFPREALEGLNVEAGDYVELVLEELIRDGERVKVYGDKLVEGEKDV